MLEDLLNAIEQQVQKVSSALLATQPELLEQETQRLRDLAARLSYALDAASGNVPETVRPRLVAVQAALAMQRDNLARVAVLTERQVAVVVPPADGGQATYGDAVGGRAMPSSSVARVYRSAG